MLDLHARLAVGTDEATPLREAVNRVFVDRATKMPSVKSGGSATGLSVTEKGR
jgi:hypothetical protein